MTDKNKTGKEWEDDAQRYFNAVESETERTFPDPEAVDMLIKCSLAASAIAQTIQLRRIGNKIEFLTGAIQQLNKAE